MPATHQTIRQTPIYCQYSGIQLGNTATVWPAETNWFSLHPVFNLRIHQLQKLTQKGSKTYQQRNLLALAYSHACLTGYLHQSQPAAFSESFLQLHFYPITSILPMLAAIPRDHAIWLNIPHLRITGTSATSNGKQIADWLTDCVLQATSKHTNILETIEGRDNSALTNLWLSDHSMRKANKSDTIAAVWDYALGEIRSTFGIPASSVDGLSIALFRAQLANPTDSKILEILATMLGGIAAVSSSVYGDKLGISARQIDQARIDLGMKQSVIRDRSIAHKAAITKLQAPIHSIDLSNFSANPQAETLSFSFTNEITVQLESAPAPAGNQYAGLSTELVAMLEQKELQKQKRQQQQAAAISAAISRRFGDLDLSGM